jgi:hypothetical protein
VKIKIEIHDQNLDFFNGTEEETVVFVLGKVSEAVKQGYFPEGHILDDDQAPIGYFEYEK